MKFIYHEKFDFNINIYAKYNKLYIIYYIYYMQCNIYIEQFIF